ncbi:uncharacterized protein [Erythrolamprus reginae]|uniref:uncharacterized protein n=1 Tax=Erythrolamprus reginae TaxID=121349 RepID=UPI00396CAA62
MHTEVTPRTSIDEDGTESMVCCSLCSMYSLLPSNLQNFTCNKCKLIQLLEEKIENLEKNLTTLKHQHHNEKIHQTPNKTNTPEELSRIHAPETVNSWTHITLRRKNKPPPTPTLLLPTPLPTSNKYSVLSEQENLQTSDKEPPRTKHNTTPPKASTTEANLPHPKPAKKKRRVLVIGDSILRGTEPPICRPDNQSREVCCLPGAKISDITENLTKILKPTDYYPLLVIHAGINDTGKDMNQIMKDYDHLGNTIRKTGAQVVFSSILPTRGRHPTRERKIPQINHWLKGWCRHKNFGFLDHGLHYLQEGLLASDGLHLTRAGKNLLGNRLAQLIRRALN